MNFKINTVKAVSLLIISLIFAYIMSNFNPVCYKGLCSVISVNSAIYFITSLIIVYLIWSLIQKGSQKQNEL